MRAMVLEKVGDPLQLKTVPVPTPKKGELLIQVSACAVCRTDLHILDGELPSPKLPLILGHQIVGKVKEVGEGVKAFRIGDRVGVPWLGGCCAKCTFCFSGRENLCADAKYTGYLINGGFAEYCVADEKFCFSLPSLYTDLEAAPLLCAGMIGYRAYSFTGMGQKLGFYGFGAAAHLLIQVALHQGREVYAFTRPGDTKAQQAALALGAKWAGSSEELSPEPLDAAIIFASVGALIPLALKSVNKGGVVVCAGIHMSDIPSFPYRLLWEERSIRSVANLTRQDGKEFLALAAKKKLKVAAHPYPLERANEAIADLRTGKFSGSAVLML